MKITTIANAYFSGTLISLRTSFHKKEQNRAKFIAWDRSDVYKQRMNNTNTSHSFSNEEKMADTVHRVISNSGKIFGIACSTTNLVNEACRRHDTGPTAAAALGRALTGAILLAALLKDGQSVRLKFEGNGPLKKIITEAGYDGWSRGYVATPRADVPLNNGMVDVASGLGRAGFLTVTKDIGLEQQYQGITQLYTSEIGEDIAFYLLESEQTPSVVAVSVQLEPNGIIKAAGGYLIQALPPVEEKILENIEQRVQKLPSFSSHLIAKKSPEEILSIVFSDIPHHTTAQTPLCYQCSCTKEKMKTALYSLGHKELKKLNESKEGLEILCEFCRNRYFFDSLAIDTILNEHNENLN